MRIIEIIRLVFDVISQVLTKISFEDAKRAGANAIAVELLLRQKGMQDVWTEIDTRLPLTPAEQLERLQQLTRGGNGMPGGSPDE